MQKTSRAELTDLEELPNIGPSIAAKLWRVAQVIFRRRRAT